MANIPDLTPGLRPATGAPTPRETSHSPVCRLSAVEGEARAYAKATEALLLGRGAQSQSPRIQRPGCGRSDFFSSRRGAFRSRRAGRGADVRWRRANERVAAGHIWRRGLVRIGLAGAASHRRSGQTRRTGPGRGLAWGEGGRGWRPLPSCSAEPLRDHDPSARGDHRLTPAAERLSGQSP